MANIPQKPVVNNQQWINGQTKLNQTNLTSGVNQNITNLKTAVDGIIDAFGGPGAEPPSTELLIPITYSELVALRDSSSLAPGTKYRITDYACTTITSNTSSAGHIFDIIVTADDVSTLNENAQAIQHSGDTYFANSNLEAWELKYCIDNDRNRFEWADSTNGKGVIYWMKDEFNNECPYDFKNILFNSSFYTFSYSGEKDASIKGLSKRCYSNVIKEYLNAGKLKLNFIVFRSTTVNFNCYGNTFGSDCHDNTFGESCSSNTFGRACAQNRFGSDCGYNSFGTSFSNNTFYGWCTGNTFGSDCRVNRFGSYCENNTFGNACGYNTFGSYCEYNTFGNFFGNYLGNQYGNTFGDYCLRNAFGDFCLNNAFGSHCENNTFGNSCCHNRFGSSDATIDYCQCIIFDSGCSYINLSSEDIEASDANKLQNVHVRLGVKGTSSAKLALTVSDRNLPYETDFYLDGSGNLKVSRFDIPQTLTAGAGISIENGVISVNYANADEEAF